MEIDKITNDFNHLFEQNSSRILIIAVSIILLLTVVNIIRYILRCPFEYPYFVHNFDVSGKRNPEMNDLIDQYLNNGYFSAIEKHYQTVQKWRNECEIRIQKSFLKNYRMKQYNDVIDDEHMYQFAATRNQTRYKQVNYKKIPYTVKTECLNFSCNFNYLNTRYQKLRRIGHSCTLKQYHSKNQRKFMTRELRERIMRRDNYTCKICGKYMPDEVGLHIDHIIPVSKGGKSIEQNLQVLCSKCNGHKSNKSTNSDIE